MTKKALSFRADFRAAFTSGAWLQRIAFGLLCLLPLLLAGKATAGIGVSLVALLFVLHSVLHRDWQWLRAPEMRLLLALWGYLLLISAFASPEPVESLRMAAGWVRFVLLFAAMRYWLLKDEHTITTFCWCVVAAVALFAADATWQYITGVSLSGRNLWEKERLSGPLTHPNIGNLMLKLIFPAACWLLQLLQSKKHPRLIGAVLALAAWVAILIPLSGERSITLLLLLSLGVFLLLLYRFRPAMLRSILLVGLFVALGTAFAATQPIVQHRIEWLQTQLKDFHHISYIQLYIAAWKMWLTHPLFGIGLTQFQDACIPLLQKDAVNFCNIHAHNIYLHWLAETGIIGLAFFVAFVCLCVRECWRGVQTAGKHAPIAMAGIAGSLTILLFPIVGTQNMLSNWPGALFWVSLGTAMAILSRIRER